MNVQGLLAGQIETPLTDEGRAQAEAAGAVLASEYPKIDLIVSSRLSRAYDTAKLIADQIDYPHEKILTNKLLAERSFGVREGTVFTFEGPFNTSKEYRALDKVKNAETFEQVHQRAAKALDYLRSLPKITHFSSQPQRFWSGSAPCGSRKTIYARLYSRRHPDRQR
jgi:broad specificity phosphatase PhoE